MKLKLLKGNIRMALWNELCLKKMSHSDTVIGRLNVKQEEIDEMLKEAPGPINFTVFLTMFGEKLKGKDSCSDTASV